MSGTPKRSRIYQLKVTLKGSKPPIWRRIQVRGDETLGTLHYVIQITMGWTNSHLHQFVVNGRYIGESLPEFDVNLDGDEDEIRLSDIVSQKKDRFVYEYDFGDGWEHAILVEQIMEPDPDATYPLCVTGKRNCPPEDVGGMWGYAEFLEAIENEDHPSHAEYLEWMGGDFDPEAFSVDEVNAVLQEWAAEGNDHA